jgi:magnesium transporter
MPLEGNWINMKEKALELLKKRKFAELRLLLNDVSPMDVATMIEELDKEDMLLMFRLLSKDLAAETFVEMDSDNQEMLISVFNDKELRAIIDELYLDDVVDIVEEMPAIVVNRILQQADPETRNSINELLKYPKDSAGSIMTIEYVDLKKDMTVEEAFNRIKQVGVDKETIYTCYVTSKNRKLLGIVTVKDLLLADKTTTLDKIMTTNIIYATTLEDKEVVAKKFEKYDFIAMPVVDKETRLVGIITVDDAVDVIQDENTEDFTKMAAMQTSDDTYFKTPVWKQAKNRVLWLLILTLSAAITGTIITNYQTAFAAVPLLVAFLPMLMDTGGNCGAQSSTMIIRGLALDEIRVGDVAKVILKEVGIALLVGLALVLVNMIRIKLMYNSSPLVSQLMIVVGLTLMCTVTIAKVLGATLPILAKACHLDPAMMASPIITTIVDMCTVIIYFGLATKLMDVIPSI